MIAQITNPSPDDARRALLLLDRPIVIDLVRLTLNHGLFVVRAASNLADAERILDTWPPHLAVVDMDHELRYRHKDRRTVVMTPRRHVTDRRGGIPYLADGAASARPTLTR